MPIPSPVVSGGSPLSLSPVPSSPLAAAMSMPSGASSPPGAGGGGIGATTHTPGGAAASEVGANDFVKDFMKKLRAKQNGPALSPISARLQQQQHLHQDNNTNTDAGDTVGIGGEEGGEGTVGEPTRKFHAARFNVYLGGGDTKPQQHTQQHTQHTQQHIQQPQQSQHTPHQHQSQRTEDRLEMEIIDLRHEIMELNTRLMDLMDEKERRREEKELKRREKAERKRRDRERAERDRREGRGVSDGDELLLGGGGGGDGSGEEDVQYYLNTPPMEIIRELARWKSQCHKLESQLHKMKEILDIAPSKPRRSSVHRDAMDIGGSTVLPSSASFSSLSSSNITTTASSNNPNTPTSTSSISFREREISRTSRKQKRYSSPSATYHYSSGGPAVHTSASFNTIPPLSPTMPVSPTMKSRSTSSPVPCAKGTITTAASAAANNNNNNSGGGGGGGGSVGLPSSSSMGALPLPAKKGLFSSSSARKLKGGSPVNSTPPSKRAQSKK